MNRSRSYLWVAAVITAVGLSFFAAQGLCRPVFEWSLEWLRGLELTVSGAWTNVMWTGIFFLLLTLFGLLSTRLLVRDRPVFAFLGFSRPGLKPGHVVACMLGSPFLTYAGFCLVKPWFDGPSEHLQAFDRMFLGQGANPVSLAATITIMSIGPAFAEEVLFRGLLFRGLLTRIASPIAVSVVAIAFAAVHQDPQHILMLLPAAFWLTWLSWRTGSIWPSILGHLFINLTSAVLFAVGAASTRHIDSWVHMAAWCVAFPCVLDAVRALYARPV